MRVPLIIDSDISPDSWAAILFAALNPQADLLAISVSGTGEAHGPRGALNVQRLLKLAGVEDLPVGFSPPDPLKGNKHFPNLMRFAIDRMMFQKINKADSSLPVYDSIELISDILQRTKKKITFSAVGPQTNLAALLTRFPELKAKIKGIYIMGGAIDVPGNIQGLDSRSNNTTAEWNFYCDPLAAQIVFDSGVPIYLVPLDATNQVPISKDFMHELTSIENPPARFYSKVIDLLTRNFGQKDTFYLWDPVTTACALNPSLATFKKRNVTMITEPGDEWGRVKETPDGTAIFVADKVDPKIFESNFLRTFASYQSD